MKATPRGIGLNLAIRLYLLLVAIVGPSLFIYYLHNFRTIGALHEREVEDLSFLLTVRMEDWLDSSGPFGDLVARERATLERELVRIVEQSPGIEGLAIFDVSPTGALEFVAGAGPSAPNRPTSRDVEAVAQRRSYTEEIKGAAGGRFRTISSPLYHGSEVKGLLHLRVNPDLIGLGRGLPRLRTNLAIGAGVMMLVVGIGVTLFFHLGVRQPIQELTTAMEQAAEGNLASLVRSRGGEFGWLATSYNRMIRRLKSSLDENRDLLDRIRRFNEELQEKIRGATEELGAKNVQLQAVNEKLFTVQREMTTLEKLATLGQVATIIAHELGTPLNAISGHIQLMLDGGVSDPKAVERLRIINGQVDRLTGIVKNVLRTMRVPSPRVEPVRVDQVIREGAELIEPVARKRGISVDLQLPGDLPSISGDADQLEQVLLNLFSNAMDAMKKGGRLTVAAGVAAPGDLADVSRQVGVPLDGGKYLRIDVSDTGRGMTDEMKKHAFEPFITSKRGDKEAGEESGMGIGLGLSICRQIVRNHRGEMSVRSDLGKGTTFTFYLPADVDNTMGYN
jgi:signal transduction histidine kinase